MNASRPPHQAAVFALATVSVCELSEAKRKNLKYRLVGSFRIRRRISMGDFVKGTKSSKSTAIQPYGPRTSEWSNWCSKPKITNVWAWSFDDIYTQTRTTLCPVRNHPCVCNATTRLLLLDQYNQTDLDSYPPSDFRTNTMHDSGVRYVTLQKMNDNQSFGFVIISSQNKAGATVGKYFHQHLAKEKKPVSNLSRRRHSTGTDWK